ncbi:MAG: hypothetical protein LBQ79_12350, partial [Deltaproteobacteria bacterium]|nr:hypothetical protein [Deltaproteobacteria bacterium]
MFHFFLEAVFLLEDDFLTGEPFGFGEGVFSIADGSVAPDNFSATDVFSPLGTTAPEVDVPDSKRPTGMSASSAGSHSPYWPSPDRKNPSALAPFTSRKTEPASASPSTSSRSPPPMVAAYFVSSRCLANARPARPASRTEGETSAVKAQRSSAASLRSAIP